MSLGQGKNILNKGLRGQHLCLILHTVGKGLNKDSIVECSADWKACVGCGKGNPLGKQELKVTEEPLGWISCPPPPPQGLFLGFQLCQLQRQGLLDHSTHLTSC